MNIIEKVTDEIYDIGKDSKDFMYFRPFYINMMKELTNHFNTAHKNRVKDTVVEMTDKIEKIYEDWKFLKNQYYKFINVKNGVMAEPVNEGDEE